MSRRKNARRWADANETEPAHPAARLGEFESQGLILGLSSPGEAMGDKVQAQSFYTALLKSTDDGSHSARPEFQHIKEFAAR